MDQVIKIRPYARLLTMLGEQLIKNEIIALIELIKNSYDADSSWVKISFNNFGTNYEISDKSEIIIEDDGYGMTAATILNSWINPATPNKKLEKENNPKTPSGRFIQGEKGIGRYAMLKLGKKIILETRPQNSNLEYKVICDFSKYDDEFLKENGESKELFIDDLPIYYSERNPIVFVNKLLNIGVRELERKPHGTKITISSLKGSWNEKKIERAYNDIMALQTILPQIIEYKNSETSEVLYNSYINDFEVAFYKDDVYLNKISDTTKERFFNLLLDRSVFRIENGVFSDINQSFYYSLNGERQEIKLSDPRIRGLKLYRDYFGTSPINRKLECGPFTFNFYIFDFSKKAPPKFLLDDIDKKIIRKHRIYLYRDGVRVYPYGEPEDDWLNIDMQRGTISAGLFLSNDQTVGFVEISHKHNPNLKDKTNREGLIEEGNATEDFKRILQIFLSYIRQHPYAIYKQKVARIETLKKSKFSNFKANFEKLKQLVEKEEAKSLIRNIEEEHFSQVKYLEQRAKITEDLAGVGLSVESASHDIMLMMGRSLSLVDNLISQSFSGKVSIELLTKELHSIRGALSFINDQLKDIQLLFGSSKQRSHLIKVYDIVEKVLQLYRRTLEKYNILVNIKTNGNPVMAKTTDAVLFQLFINLFDNSIFWLQQVDSKEKEILVVFDGFSQSVIFSDNGPGIDQSDAPYIFEPFFSGKGEEGRGLGLYIARQLLDRYNYTIDLVTSKQKKVLSGANFIISFIKEDKYGFV